MSDEWGPWIQHDGNGCPCVGEYVHRVFDVGVDILNGERVTESNEDIGIVVPEEGLSWCGVTSWRGFRVPQVIRYRIRKPRGMVILENLLADMPRVGEVEVI